MSGWEKEPQCAIPPQVEWERVEGGAPGQGERVVKSQKHERMVHLPDVNDQPHQHKVFHN